MFERRNVEPSRVLVELARLHTAGEVSARHHAASRSRVLDRLTGRSSVPGLRLAVGLAGVFLMGGAAFGVAKYRAGVAAHAMAPTESVAPNASEEAPDDPFVADDDKITANKPTVTIHAEPESAKIFWDDEALDGNPATWTGPADGKHHRIRAEAAGFVTKTEVLTGDYANSTMWLDLDPIPPDIGPISGTGAVTEASSVLDGMRGRFRKCYDEGLSDDSSMVGKAILTVRIAANGRVVSCDITENEGLSTEVTTCLAQTMRDAHLRVAGKETKLVIPMAFGGKFGGKPNP
jgi:hypothetical protein